MEDTRISRDRMLLEMAFIAALRGTCGRLSVGAIIARDSRPVSLGYVGAPSGEPHCWEVNCDMAKPCLRTRHAEWNAVDHAHRHGIGIVGATMYCTDSPCQSCALVIQQAGIARVVYNREYRMVSPIEFLREHNVIVDRVARS